MVSKICAVITILILVGITYYGFAQTRRNYISEYLSLEEEVGFKMISDTIMADVRVVIIELNPTNAEETVFFFNKVIGPGKKQNNSAITWQNYRRYWPFEHTFTAELTIKPMTSEAPETQIILTQKTYSDI